jgi:hypothetical protein
VERKIKRFGGWLRGSVLFVSLLCFIGAGTNCSLFQSKGTVIVTNLRSDRVYCEFLWGPQNKTFYLNGGMTETCELKAGSYTFQVSTDSGQFIFSSYIYLDKNTTQTITIPDWD